MKEFYKTLFRTLVTPFYKENAGFFVLVFIIMFCIIGKVDGAGVFEYHYSLIKGMLQNFYFLLFVFSIWGLYAWKYTAFVSGLMRHPKYAFLYIYNAVESSKQLRAFLLVEVLLLMPVLVYCLFVFAIGYHEHLYLSLLVVATFLILLCAMPAWWHRQLLNKSDGRMLTRDKSLRLWPAWASSYQNILVRFVAAKLKIIWIGIKVFTCGILFLVARNNTTDSYDISFPFLFFNFGILANGVIICRLRAFEETWLSFYRGAPVSLARRFSAYLLVYFVLLIPEFLTTYQLSPIHLHSGDALNFSLGAYSLLLLMNSLTFFAYRNVKEFLKTLLLIFCVQYIFLMTVGLTSLYVLFFLSAVVLFYYRYYKFERVVPTSL